MARIPFPEYAVLLAWLVSLRSEDPHRKVGAVGLTKENRVFAAGYNGLRPGMVVPLEFWANRDARRKYCIHAEQNLLAQVRRGDLDTVGLTCSPCTHCASALSSCDVQKVFYYEKYDSIGLEILEFHGIFHQQINPFSYLHQFLNSCAFPIPHSHTHEPKIEQLL